LVDGLSLDEKSTFLLPKNQGNLMANRYEPDDCAVELALEQYNTHFTSHPEVREHVSDIWFNDVYQKMDFVFPNLNNFESSIDSIVELPLQMVKNVSNVITVDFMFAPATRFFLEFFNFMVLSALVYLEIFYFEVTKTRWTYSEALMMFYATGFLLNEIDQAYAAFSEKRFSKYVTDLWNWFDWCIYFVFGAYAAIRFYVIFTDHGEQVDDFDFGYFHTLALRCLSVNCVFLNLRFLNVLTITETFGPFIRMIVLMAWDVVKVSHTISTYLWSDPVSVASNDSSSWSCLSSSSVSRGLSLCGSNRLRTAMLLTLTA
jgi:hypothetical protein